MLRWPRSNAASPTCSRVMSSSTDAVAVLDAAYAARSPIDDPLGRAAAAYRLAVAVGESTPADHRRALRLLDEARRVLTEARAPLEHGRILTAAASQHRGLSEPVRAAELFEQAAQLLDERAGPEERAAAWSNVGLARSELGRFGEAVDAFDRASAVLASPRSAQRSNESARVHATVLINRGLALFGLGRFADARADLEAGLGGVDVNTAPVQTGMAHHSLGQLATAEDRRADAIAHFTAALQVFTATSFPQQHAVTTFNLGVAYAGGDELADLRRALWYFEATANLFDPRSQAEQWRQAAARLGDVTRRLADLDPRRTQAEHRAALLGSVSDDERLPLMRALVERFAARPDPQRTDAFHEAAAAVSDTPDVEARSILRTALFVLAELPDPVLRAALTGQLRAHAELSLAERFVADSTLDQLIQELFQGPQRVRFRDVLYELGWERP